MLNRDVVVKTKALSVNKCWQGRRFKTKEYVDYEAKLLRDLPDILIPAGPLRIDYEFGFSYSGADIDNVIKPLQDILQKRYDFDDNRIYYITVKKNMIKKWYEYIRFNIKNYDFFPVGDLRTTTTKAKSKKNFNENSLEK